MKSLMLRKRFSKQARNNELDAFESAGISKANIVRGIILAAIGISLLVVFHRKILTWFTLAFVNLFIIIYYCSLRRRNVQLNEDALLQTKDDQTVVSRTTKQIYVV